jgi:hypothetical protein
MQAHKKSYIVTPARLVHARARLTCIRPRQLDAWPKASSGQHHWLREAVCRATGPGPPSRLSSAGPVSLSWQDSDVNCTATGHLSSRWLILRRAGVLSYIRASGSKPCFAAGLGFTVIHVEARPGDVMAGADGAAGPEPDVRHQTPGRTVYIYHNYKL